MNSFNDGSARNTAHALLDRGRQARRKGQSKLAYETLHQAYEMFRGQGDCQGTGYAALEMARNVQSFVPQGVSDIFHYRENRCAEAIALFKKVGDERGLASALRLMSACLTNADAKRELQECLNISRRIGDVSGEARALDALGARMCIEGERVAGLRQKLQALELARSANDEETIADILLSLAVSCEGSATEKRALFEEAHDLFRRRQEWYQLYYSLVLCADLACDDADLAQKEMYLQEALTLSRQMGNAERETMCAERLLEVKKGREDQPAKVLLEAGQNEAAEPCGIPELNEVFARNDPDEMIEFMRKLVGNVGEEESKDCTF